MSLKAEQKARAYLATQAAAGALWWAAVLLSTDVRRWTLGDWDPQLLVGPDLVLFVGASGLAAALGSRVFAAVAAVWTIAVTAALATYALVEQVAGWGVVLMAMATVGTVSAALTLWFGRLPVQWLLLGPFAVRTSPDDSRGGHLRRSLAQLVVFWTVFFIVLPFVLASVEQRLRLDWAPLQDGLENWIGVVALVLASALGVWSCTSMALHGEGTPLPAKSARKLVVVGPYCYVRNPMAAAGVIQAPGVGLWLGSGMVIVSAVAGGLFWNTVIRPQEEADLARRFGRAYLSYREDVRCWLPTSDRCRLPALRR